MAAESSEVRAPRSQAVQGALLAALAMWLFSVQDAFFKAMSEHYSVVMILFLRSAGTLPLAAGLVWREGGREAFRSRHLGLQLLRGVLLFLMFLGYYLALTYLPLATAVALVFSAPIMTTLLSAAILKERIGIHRLGAAVLVGFLGVLIMVRPGGGAFAWPALLCLMASFCYALSMVMTRQLGAVGEPRPPGLLSQPGVYFLGSAALLPATWTPIAFWITPAFDRGLRALDHPRAPGDHPGLPHRAAAGARSLRLHDPRMGAPLGLALLERMARLDHPRRRYRGRRRRALRRLPRGPCRPGKGPAADQVMVARKALSPSRLRPAGWRAAARAPIPRAAAWAGGSGRRACPGGSWPP